MKPNGTPDGQEVPASYCLPRKASGYIGSPDARRTVASRNIERAPIAGGPTRRLISDVDRRVGSALCGTGRAGRDHPEAVLSARIRAERCRAGRHRRIDVALAVSTPGVPRGHARLRVTTFCAFCSSSRYRRRRALGGPGRSWSTLSARGKLSATTEGSQVAAWRAPRWPTSSTGVRQRRPVGNRGHDSLTRMLSSSPPGSP